MNLYEHPDLAGTRPLSASEYDRAVDDGESAFDGGVMRGSIRRPMPRDPACPTCGSATWDGRCFACALSGRIARVNAEIEARHANDTPRQRALYEEAQR